MKKAAVVILNWNGKKLLEQFLPVLITHTPSEIADIVVADNASEDDSISFLEKEYPDTKVIRLDKNYGYAEGYNRALEHLNQEYVVLLNSDVEVTSGWLQKAIEYLDAHPDVSALQPKILSYHQKEKFEYAGACGGFLDCYGYPFCRGRILEEIETDYGQYDTVHEVMWASGACLFIRSKVFRNAGGFDAYFFAHQEEIDLCWRLVNEGKKIVCFPFSVIYHIGGATLKMEHPHKTFLNFRNNLIMLYKNMPEKYLIKALLVRYFLDIIAMFVFVCKGYPANAKSVILAWRAYLKQKKIYKKFREIHSSKSLSELPPLIYRKSIIFAFYFGKKKKFSQFSGI